jgi:acyl-CoA reductase-like NAD-dependent aldehyde dehydrogenase
MQIINPATEELIQEIAEDDLKKVNGKFEILKKGQPAWAATPVEKRIGCIARFHALLDDQKKELAETLTREMGKPLKQSYNELNGARSRIQYFLDNAASANCSRRSASKSR